ncbi:unnamed protein product, partial [Scytosiphon promiscuus]
WRRRRPRWADAQHEVRESAGGRREAGRAHRKQQPPPSPPQKQQEYSAESFDRDSTGSVELSARKDEADSEAGLCHSDGLQGGADGVDVGRDEISTAECSAETTGRSGGGGEAVGVSFDLGSDDDDEEEK